MVARGRGTDGEVGKSGVRRVKRPVIQCMGFAVILGTENSVVTVRRGAVDSELRFGVRGFCVLGMSGASKPHRRFEPASSAAFVRSRRRLEREDGWGRQGATGCARDFRRRSRRDGAGSRGAAYPDEKT